MAAFSYLPVDQAQTHRTPRVTVHLWHPVAGLIVTRVEGHYTAEAATFVDGLTRRHAKVDARLLFMHDWWEAEDYDREARDILVGLGRDLLPMVDGSHILFRSKLVAFGVQAAAIVLRNITTYTERATFEAALAEAMRARSAPSRRGG